MIHTGELIFRFFFLQRYYLSFWNSELFSAPIDLTSSRLSLAKSIIIADGRTRTGTGLLRPNGF